MWMSCVSGKTKSRPDHIKMATPPTPEKPYIVGDIASDSVTIAWQVKGNAKKITHYRVCVVKTDAKGNYISSTGNILTKSACCECTLQGLMPDTFYKFLVISHIHERESEGSEYSSVIRTPEACLEPYRLPIPDKPVANGTPTHDSIPLSWRVHEDDTEVSHYTIVAYSGREEMNFITSDAKQTYTVSGLSPNTRYYFKVLSNKGKATSFSSAYSDIITTPDKPKFTPRLRDEAGEVIHDGVTFVEEAVDGTGTQDMAFSSESDRIAPVMTGGKEDVAKIKYPNPTDDVKRTKQVCGVASTKRNEDAETQVCHRLPVPGKPIVVAEPGHDCVSLAWGVKGNTSIVTHYTVTYRKANSSGPWQVVSTDDPMPSCTVRGLEEKTKYFFDVTSHTATESSTPSKRCVICTAELHQNSRELQSPKPHQNSRELQSPKPNQNSRELQSPKPLKPSAGDVTYNSVTLAWDVLGDVEEVDQYKVKCKKVNSTGPVMKFCTDNLKTKFTANDLQPLTGYIFSVIIKTKRAEKFVSEESDIITTLSDPRGRPISDQVIPLPFKAPTHVDAATSTSVSLDGATSTPVATDESQRVGSGSLRIVVETNDHESLDRVQNSAPDASNQPSVIGDGGINGTTEMTRPSTTRQKSVDTSYQSTVTGDTGKGSAETGKVTRPVTSRQKSVDTSYQSTVTGDTGKGSAETGKVTRPATSRQKSVDTTDKSTLTGDTGKGSAETGKVTRPVTSHQKSVDTSYQSSKTGDDHGKEGTGKVTRPTTTRQKSVETSNQSALTGDFDRGTSHANEMTRPSATRQTSVGCERPSTNGRPTFPTAQRPTLSGQASCDSLPLSWQVDGDTSYVTHYTITYKKADSKSWVTFDTPSAATQCFIDGLDPVTSYQFRVAVNTDKGRSRPSEISEIKTAEDPKIQLRDQIRPIPTKPYVAGNVSHNSIQLSWDLQVNAPAVAHYTIKYKKAKSRGAWGVIESYSTETSCVVDDLEPDTSYIFRVASNTSMGQSRPSEESDAVATLEEPKPDRDDQAPPTPMKPYVDEEIQPCSIPLSWNVAGSTKHVINYTVSYRAAAKSKARWMSIDTDDAEKDLVVEDLDPGMYYEFRVASNTDYGQSLPSETSDQIVTPVKETTNTKEPEQEPLQIPIPEKPELEGTPSQNSIPLIWKMHGTCRADRILYFTVSYRKISGQKKSPWMAIETDNAVQSHSVKNLDVDAAYQFRVAANSHVGQSKPSEMSEIICTQGSASARPKQNPPIPRNLTQTNSKSHDPHNSLTLAWNTGRNVSNLANFTLKYRPVSSGNGARNQWFMIETDGPRMFHTITNLKPTTSYEVCIAANTKDGYEHKSDKTEIFTTSDEPTTTDGNKKQSQKSGCRAATADSKGNQRPREVKRRGGGRKGYREELLQDSKIAESDKEMPLYQVPLTATGRNKKDRIQKFEFGNKPDIPPEEKVILVVGATGAGKSTLINGLLNYVLGVEWEEETRFRIVEESSLFSDQHKSQTRSVTVYTLHHDPAFKVPYSVTIIDTPGFGDTGGMEKDKLITEAISSLFRKEEYGLDHIDAVGFVAQATLPRLTPTQKYIFDSILSLFGRDIGDNIFLLLTFCDSQKPPVLASIGEANIPYKSYFKFNNSAVFACNDTEDNDFDRLFWKMGMMSFNRFLGQLKTVEGKSLRLTKEVLEERQQLEVYIEGIQNELKNGLNKLEEYKVELEVVKQHKADLERNRDFTYTVDEVNMTRIKLGPGENVTNCLNCNRTCHHPCAFRNDQDKRRCSAMNWYGCCRICPKHCYWDIHRNVPYQIVTDVVRSTKTSEDLRRRYNEAFGGKIDAHHLTEQILNEYYQLEMRVIFHITEVKRSLERLGEIALKPNPLTVEEYLDILIEGEESEAKPGFQARISQLEQVKVLASKAISTEGRDIFEGYRESVKRAKHQQDRPLFEDYTEDIKKEHPNIFQRIIRSVRDFVQL